MPKVIDEFAYVVIDVTDPDAWERFATDLLGVEVASVDGGLGLRMDDRPFRYLLRKSHGDALPILGWGASDAGALKAIERSLLALGIEASYLDAAEVAVRGAGAGIRFRCHNGINHEVVTGLAPSAASGPGKNVSGFVTGAGGLGHVVWSVPDVEAMDRLMIDGFGMELREDIATPAGPGHFYGCNPRHHSLAVFNAPTLRLEHLMVEMADLDDVGCAMDRAIDYGYNLTQPLGRHRTDHMVSFYVETPSAFGMEIGCNGLLCGPNWPDVRDASRKRPWGHGTAMRRHHKAQEASRGSK